MKCSALTRRRKKAARRSRYCGRKLDNNRRALRGMRQDGSPIAVGQRWETWQQRAQPNEDGTARNGKNVRRLVVLWIVVRQGVEKDLELV